ncbi:hypothetical protein [Clostridium tetani]|uniref:hypothetical protein n=1 Tax=Clostridium tetani TaxID=1513 RepID=UPI002954E9AC|nr:hypothetical protein [Clostridium tetani]BDR85985.1 hypothetical protein N071400001_05930 [Clostridium tetani]
MEKKKSFKGIIVFLILAITLGGFGYRNSDIYRRKSLKKKIHAASQKTIQYYYDEYKPQQFAGILDWPALGLYGLGEDVSGEVWTVNGKNGAYWRDSK